MLKIGDFSKLSRVSVRMLRHYDEIGLLRPAETDPANGYRYYSAAQLEMAERIRALKDMGFGLNVICRLIECEDVEEALKLFRIREEEVRKEAETAAYRLKLLETARKRLRKEEKMNYNVTLKTIPARKVASVRMTLPAYDEEGIAWGVLCEETEHMHLVPDDPCLCCAVFHDDEYKESDVDIEVTKSVIGDYPDTEHVRFRMESAVTVASAIHNGSYRGLDAAMGNVAQWVQENGYELAGPVFCIYHVSPHETENPDEYVTEICYPVRGK